MQVAGAAPQTALQCKLKAAFLLTLSFADDQATLAAYTLQTSLEARAVFRLWM